jgi:ubiquinone/menaquinone biosynthesis C-methylase UbiE/uncharacterized protein YbaR (Trm112 family)
MGSHTPGQHSSLTMRDLTRLLTCPQCQEPQLLQLKENDADQHLECPGCSVKYEIHDGIPVLLPPDFVTMRSENERAAAALAHKRQQASFTDEETDEQWEIGRPRGAPAFYGWLFEEKFRRSIAALFPLLPGATALTVCGGSGLDAEFLARAGARVITSDISLLAAMRARERARRHGAALTPVVADVENLPFGDRTIDLVYVHDGLHHLEEPAVGLAEMARVASRAVSVNEPARATATAIAIGFGVALEQEEAGNRVARLTVEDIVAGLETRGFQTLEAHRYAMYYKHAPGPAMRFMSRQNVMPFATVAFTSFNRWAGGIGNKLTVQAIRTN